MRCSHSRLALLFAASLCVAAPSNAGPAEPEWVSGWASAQMVPEGNNALPPDTLDDATLRQLVRVTIGGERLKLRISNDFGRAPLTISGVHVARALSGDSARIDPASDRAVTFGGLASVTIPAGAYYLSDPIDLSVPALATLAVSMHFPDQAVVQTGHPGSRATSYVVRGNALAAPDMPGAQTFDRWYHLGGIEVLPAARAGAIAILGDSITDGYGVKPNTNSRWPDFLMQRLQAEPRTRSLAVLNLGIGGNRMLNDGLGPNAVARFDRDVLSRNGVEYLVLLEGVNDLGTLTRDAPVSAEEHRLFVERMKTSYAQIVARARSKRIKVIGATVLPYGGSAYYHPTEFNEADRQALNAWIRAPGNFDAVIDFDAVMRDPLRPNLMRAEYDSGDGLHPSIAGYKAMAEAVPLSLFAD